MKISLLLVAAVFLVAVVSSKKVGKEHKEKTDVRSEKHNHNKKKYSDHHSHHDSKKKSHSYENLNKNKVPDTESLKKTKENSEITKQGGTSHIGKKPAKKTSSNYHTQDEHEDLHLQDLSHPSDPSNFRQDKSPHDHHKGHKMSHQSASYREEKLHNSKEQENKKLFVDNDPKEKEPSQSHSVLENSFETINDEAAKEDVQEVQSRKKHTSKENSSKNSFETIDNVAIEEGTQEVQPRKKHNSKEKSSKKAHEKSEKNRSHKNLNKVNGKKGKKSS